MRLTIIALFALIVAPVLAADWGSYKNARFGYVIDVPPGFTGQGAPDNGDGQEFLPASPTAKLIVWGGNVIEDNFESDVVRAMTYAEDDGWAITYQATTPRWASYSGTKGKRILYVRTISLCNGAQYATFQLEYIATDIEEFDPVVNRLVRSLKATGNGVSC
jgi:hypothetical protein